VRETLPVADTVVVAAAAVEGHPKDPDRWMHRDRTERHCYSSVIVAALVTSVADSAADRIDTHSFQ